MSMDPDELDSSARESAELIAMFDAALRYRSTVTLNSQRCPLAEGLLRTWASARNLRAELEPMTAPGLVPWNNLHVWFGPLLIDGYITITSASGS